MALHTPKETISAVAVSQPRYARIKAGQRVTLFDLNAIDAWLQSHREVA